MTLCVQQCNAFQSFNIRNKTESMTEREQPADWDHFHVLLEQLLKRVPSLRDASLERLCNGPEAFSPDCKWILGESPEVRIEISL